MNIRLEGAEWYINGYMISGDSDDGYYVYPEGSEDCVFDSKNFEECLTWVYNS